MKATDYSITLKAINKKANLESAIQKWEMGINLLCSQGFPRSHMLTQFIAQDKGTLDKVNKALQLCFKHFEERCKFLEDNLTDAHRIVGNQRSNDIYERDKVERAKTLFKEAASKNGELDVKIAESEAALATLEQELAAITQAKADLVAGMNDQQKGFILEKARSDDDTVIIDLILGSGFDEQSYLALHGYAQDESQLAGEHDAEEVVDVFEA